ncbi:MAG TPA: MmgE/PrpD family protein [Propionibacterium sp.]|jgi:2-methylcitrate dehydratase PrpD|nr:MmgE/PrpD family protein [Propionibacterium sp.]
MTEAHIDVTAILARFATARRGPVTGAARADVARCVLDTVAVSIAALPNPGLTIFDAWAATESAAGPCAVWGRAARTAPAAAALRNGTAAHVLDYDDLVPGRPSHPSVVLLPALLAVADARGHDFDQVAPAFMVGSATFRAFADALPHTEHYDRGWHTTSTVGRVAAVTALAHLVGLDEGATRRALGIVTSLAAGSLANFGTMVKPMHSGAAARDAVLAVDLAERGLTANGSALEARGGFVDLYGSPDDARLAALPALLEAEYDGWRTDWALKQYPACYGTNRAIDAALALRAQLGGALPDDIESVRVVTHPTCLRPLLRRRAEHGQEARFSMEYVVATALAQGGLTLVDFEPEGFAANRENSLIDRVTMSEADVPPVGPPDYSEGYTVVTIETASGDRLSVRRDVTHGDSSDPLTDAELLAKVRDCFRAGGLDQNEAESTLSHWLAWTSGIESPAASTS